jgi:signal transduction histidine kinase/DNA-binding NarL/FixJ family response regulator
VLVVFAALKQPAFTKLQSTLLIGSIFLPWVVNILYIIRLITFSFDPTPIAISLSGVLFGLNIYRLGLVDIVPVARDILIDIIPDAILAINVYGHLIDVNPFACELIDTPRNKAIGRPAKIILQRWPTLVSQLQNNAPIDTLTLPEIISDTENRSYAVTTSQLYDLRQKRTGWVFIFRDITAQKAAEELLQEQKIELALRDERERMSRDLHDGLAQTVSSIGMQTQATQTLLLRGEQVAAQNNLDTIVQLTNNANKSIRNFILGLRTSFDDRRSLYDTLDEYLTSFTEQTKIQTSLRIMDASALVGVSSGAEEQIIRIIAEAVTNVRKHANASAIEIFFLRVNDMLSQIVIMDDGKGFDEEIRSQKELNNHFGLKMMKERAEIIGGKLDIISESNFGTKLFITFPAKNQQIKANDVDLHSLRFLLVDDSVIFLEGLTNLLQARGITVVGHAIDGFDAQEKVKQLKPDIVVMDIMMPGCNGIEATKAIKQSMPKTKVVILTTSEQDEHLFEAFHHGADGFLMKGIDANEFCDALLQIAQGEQVLSRDAANRVIPGLTTIEGTKENLTAKLKGLQPDDIELIKLISSGMNNAEIALKHNVTPKTISNRIARILNLTQLANRVQLVTFALNNNIVSLEEIQQINASGQK